MCFGVFRNAEDISVWIFEPGDACAGRGCPYSKFVGPQKIVALKRDACVHQVADGDLDVWDLPADDGADVGRELLAHAEAQHDAMSVEYQRVGRFFFDEAKAERVAIEGFGAFDIDDGCEGDEIVLAEIGGLRH